METMDTLFSLLFFIYASLENLTNQSMQQWKLLKDMYAEFFNFLCLIFHFGVHVNAAYKIFSQGEGIILRYTFFFGPNQSILYEVNFEKLL